MFDILRGIIVIVVGLVAWAMFIYISTALIARAWFTEQRISMRIWAQDPFNTDRCMSVTNIMTKEQPNE